MNSTTFKFLVQSFMPYCMSNNNTHLYLPYSMTTWMSH